MKTSAELGILVAKLATKVSDTQETINDTIFNKLKFNDILELSEDLVIAQAKLECLQEIISKLNKDERYVKILQKKLNLNYKRLASTDRYESQKAILIMKAEAQIIEIVLN